MGNRLSKIYTRTGDDGSTGLGDGSRVAKEDLRVEAYGTVDETNSALGVLLGNPGVPAQIRRALTEIQHDLFDLGGELCIPGHVMINAAHVERLEKELDALNEDLPPLKEFILPGGGPAAAACHLARAICRRAERRAQSVSADALKYLNRLSDLLFVMARVLARSAEGEVVWRRNSLPKS
jgi:cob(I)alamin adenosyltransferase